MAFDESGQLYLTHAAAFARTTITRSLPRRGRPRSFDTSKQKQGVWAPAPDEYAIGLASDNRNASGGVDIGESLTSAGTPSGHCDMLWSTGGPLNRQDDPTTVQGLQGNPTSAVRPANVPPSKPTSSIMMGFSSILPRKATSVRSKSGGLANPSLCIPPSGVPAAPRTDGAHPRHPSDHPTGRTHPGRPTCAPTGGSHPGPDARPQD